MIGPAAMKGPRPESQRPDAREPADDAAEDAAGRGAGRGAFRRLRVLLVREVPCAFLVRKQHRDVVTENRAWRRSSTTRAAWASDFAMQMTDFAMNPPSFSRSISSWFSTR
jgi:hypothetical protein